MIYQSISRQFIFIAVILMLPTISFSTNSFSFSNTLNNKCGKNAAYCKGSHVFADGSRYEGEFRYGQPDGQGKMIWKDGSRYEGQFKKGIRHGQGEQSFMDGSSYVGEFINGFMQGQGLFTFACGHEYHGNFHKDKMDGKGAIHFINGESYNGDWVEELPDGNGTYTLVDGTRYLVDYRSGKRHGEGTVAFTTGDLLTTQWKKGNPAKEARFQFQNGDQLIGKWNDYSLLDQLTYTSHTGITVTGNIAFIELEMERQITDQKALQHNLALLYYSIALELKMAKQNSKAIEIMREAQSRLSVTDALYQIIQKQKQSFTNNVQIN